jgi:hypothetical protein
MRNTEEPLQVTSKNGQPLQIMRNEGQPLQITEGRQHECQGMDIGSTAKMQSM